MAGRFEFISEEGCRDTHGRYIDIIMFRDTQTGVLYIAQLGGGITPLLDSDGKPVATVAVNQDGWRYNGDSGLL